MAAALAGGVVGCGGDGLEDRTARVTIDGRSSTFQVDSCGIDENTVFVVGRTDGGAILQAVIGVTFPDGATVDETVPDEEAVPTSTGITVDVGETVWGAFGSESWSRRGKTGAAPGTITSARIRGARIQATGDVVEFDGDEPATTGINPVAFELDARCDDTTA